MNELTVTTHAPDETENLGRRLGCGIESGLCVALIGTLGAGKTHFVRGVAAGMDVPSDVTVNSPTFVICNEYPGRCHVYHIDAYRLGGSGELSAIGFEEMLRDSAIVLVEWADRVVDALPDDHLRAEFEHAGETVRRITFAARGDRARRTLEALDHSS